MKYIILLVLFTSFLFAHKLNLFVTDESDSLEIYSYFTNGVSCKNCKLIIKSDEKTIIEDVLNDEGKFNYKPINKNIEVIVDATGGHIATEKVEVSNVKSEDIKDHIKDHKKEENKSENIRILIAFGLMFLIFFLLKKFKK